MTRGSSDRKKHKLSTKSCGSPKLSALKWSRLNDLSALKWSRICAEMVALLINILYVPVIKIPVFRAAPFVDNPLGYPPTGLHLLQKYF